MTVLLDNLVCEVMDLADLLFVDGIEPFHDTVLRCSGLGSHAFDDGLLPLPGRLHPFFERAKF